MISAALVLMMVAGPFAILDVPVFDGEWSNLSQNGTPIVPPKPVVEIMRYSDAPVNLLGYVDIMGFANTTIINGHEYIEVMDPITHVSVWCPYGHDYVQSFSCSEVVSAHESVATVVMTADVNWADVKKSEHSTVIGYRNNILTFSDSVRYPDIFTPPEAPAVELVQYLNATTPHTLMAIPELAVGVTTFTLEYNNSSISKHILYGTIETNEQDVEQVNYTEISTWERTGTLCTHRSDMIVIEDAPLNQSELRITQSHPYGEVLVTNISTVNVTTAPDKPFVEGGFPIFCLLAIPLILLGAAVYMIRRLI